jgi:hypothetical protein
MNLYALLLLVHSWNRWIAVTALLASTGLAWYGWFADKPYTKRDNMLRGMTVGLNHLQVIFGFVLYFQSPLVAYLRSDMQGGLQIPDVTFFGVIHISVMIIAAFVLTVGGTIARRSETDMKKFRTVAIFFTIALALILLAMPSPISPFAVRPWMRLDF